MAEDTKQTVRNEKPITGESLAEQMKRATENGTLGGTQDPLKPVPKRKWAPLGECPSVEKN